MRLFTGLSIPPRVLASLSEALDRLRSTAHLKWSPVENLHVTLKFIGEWPEARLPELRDVLEAMPKPGPFGVGISRFGYFPNPHRPRHFFAGVHGEPGLANLARSIDEALVKIGCLGEKRPYAPHLTLARIKDENIQGLREHIAAMTNFEFGSFEATEFHLYLSKPDLSKTGTGGSVYSILSTFPLAPGAAA